MSDFGTVRNRILSDLNRTSSNDLTSTAETEINSAIAFYEKRRFWFLEGRTSTYTVDGQEYYALPDDFRDDDSLVVNASGTTYPLIKRPYSVLESWYTQSTSKGTPSDYAIYDEQIRLYPIPNGAYQMTLSYYKELPTLSAASDTNAWMTEGEGLIRARVEWVLNVRKLHDYDAAQACRELEAEELAQHERITRARLMTGKTRKRSM